ncbi:nuclear transport factor 2 family protein [Nocardia sp. CDC186]|uniref:Nuclear transport factor 2 family protein n=1 Tax=Nocardia implantans TaxID=3108168 RepID=A0ABU6AU88_9NOCA|nr:nuclear transport factor 2 family protein [Nocardia sp. CDC186]MEB3511037.1 nuclear transport factor 2 family protein [Nocardia sp. CDC186]
MNNTWSREELESAFQTWRSTVARAASGEGSWREFVDLFTPDAEYHEQMVGVLRGPEAIWAWAEPTLARFPGSAMTSFPDYWHLIDDVNGMIVVKLNNLMRDPGDGSQMGADNISILTYAGDGKFSKEEDVYDPAEFARLIPAWCRRAMELGTLSEADLECCALSFALGPPAPA